MGAIASALAGIYFSWSPAPLHIALSLLAGGVMGALWGLIPALLKAYLECMKLSPL